LTCPGWLAEAKAFKFLPAVYRRLQSIAADAQG
jgi:hypothetical protein